MVLGGPTLHVRGEVASTEDLVIECTIESASAVWCEGCAVTVGENATIKGDIVARDITALGAVSGTLLATEVVEIRKSANVSGRVVAQQFILEDGATFNGRVEPQHLQTALTVAKHRRAERDAAPAAAAEPRPAAPRPGPTIVTPGERAPNYPQS